jgi:hypothetical protein
MCAILNDNKSGKMFYYLLFIFFFFPLVVVCRYVYLYVTLIDENDKVALFKKDKDPGKRATRISVRKERPIYRKERQ